MAKARRNATLVRRSVLRGATSLVFNLRESAKSVDESASIRVHRRFRFSVSPW